MPAQTWSNILKRRNDVQGTTSKYVNFSPRAATGLRITYHMKEPHLLGGRANPGKQSLPTLNQPKRLKKKPNTGTQRELQGDLRIPTRSRGIGQQPEWSWIKVGSCWIFQGVAYNSFESNWFLVIGPDGLLDTNVLAVLKQPSALPWMATPGFPKST